MTTERFHTKAITDFSIKSIDRGEVVAVVSTLNHVDREGDVVLPGAIKDGSTVKLSAYEHDVITEGKPPVGDGVVNIQGNQAVLAARYYMTTERGRDAFNTVKEMGASSEWSIGFSKNVQTSPLTADWQAKGARRLIARLTLLEASPVFMGANDLTSTISAKAAAAAVQIVDAAEAEWQAELRSIYNRHVLPDVLREHGEEAKAMREESDLRQVWIRLLDRELTRPDSYAAPKAFDDVIEFARAELGLDWRALPAPRFVGRNSLKSAEGAPSNGAFVVVDGRPRVFLADGRDFEQIVKTFFHEAVHCRQHFFGDAMSEVEACTEADRLFARWSANS